jgi:hypothetical protein
MTTKRISRFLCIASVFVAGSLKLHAQLALNDGLVGFYPFSGNANDESGNGRHGTVSGVVGTNDRFGQPGKAYVFGGDGDHVVVSPAPNFWSTGTFSFSCWIRIAPGGSSQPRILHNKTLDVALTETTGNPQIFFGGAATDGIATTNRLKSNFDYHVAGTYDGSKMMLFVNGFIEAQAVVNWSLQASALPLGIGRNLETTGDWFSGVIDDVRLFNRALTKVEIEQLYVMESPERVTIKKAVNVEGVSLLVGSNYQLQTSADLQTWIDHGAAFVATNSNWRSTNYWDVENWDSLHFRFRRLP